MSAEVFVAVVRRAGDVCDRLFPLANGSTQALKLRKEAVELQQAIDQCDVAKTRNEVADCFIVLAHVLRTQNITFHDLALEIEAKLRVLEARTWERLPDGTYQHVKAGAP